MYVTNDHYSAIYLGDFTVGGFSRELQLDLLSGDFFIDGTRAGHLTDNITKHRDFTRLFGSTEFYVLPDGGERGRFVTRYRDHDPRYTFALRQKDDNSLLQVIEKHSSEEFLFVSSQALEQLFRKELVANYSHWFNIAKNIIDFRPQQFNTADFISNIDFQLDLSSGDLMDLKRDGQVVKINSESFNQTQYIFNRIEFPEYIHVILKNNSSQVIVDLHRLNLQFEIIRDESIHDDRVRSLQYSNMCVSLDQKCFGVLIGFMRGLLLKPIKTFADLMPCAILIPHAVGGGLRSNSQKIQILSAEGHQRVDICRDSNGSNIMEHLQYFKYDVDTRLQQLRAPPGVEASVFLARLHASTASPLPEPFTGLTGTEMALRILQSAICWSPEISDDTNQHLRAIQELAPVHIFSDTFPLDPQPFLQKFPEALSSLCAHIAFKLVIDKLNERIIFSSAQSHHLRAYYRSKFLYSPQAQIDLEFEPRLNTLFPSADATGWAFNIEHNALSVIAELCSNWRVERTEKFRTGMLKQLLISSVDLPANEFPVNASPANVFGFLSDWRSSFDFCNKWFTLYTFARSIRTKKQYKDYWQLLLSGLIFPKQKVPLEHLLLLHAVAVHPDDFPEAPPYKVYTTPDDNAPNEAAIATICLFCEQSEPLENYMARNSHPKLNDESEADFTNRIRAERQQAIIADSKQVYQRILRIWPNDNCDIRDLGNYKVINNWLPLHNHINERLRHWYANRQLVLFVERVEQQAAKYISGLTSLAITDTPVLPQQTKGLNKPLDSDLLYLRKLQLPPNISSDIDKIYPKLENRVEPENFSRNANVTIEETAAAPFPLDIISEDLITNNFIESLKQSWGMYSSRRYSRTSHSNTRIVYEFKKIRLNLLDQLNTFWQLIEDHLKPTLEEYTLRALSSARLTPASVPLVLLKRFFKSEDVVEVDIKPFQQLVGAYVVLQTREMRATRILRFARSGPSMEAFLHRELENEGHEKWIPAEHPEWLLFELERDLLIRPVQIDVAKRMAPPPGKIMKNSIVQLQMGEGKTAVIVPLLILQLADGLQLCRLTVMRSLFQTNERYLHHVLGGLLNRRVYSFPYNRETIMDTIELRKKYEECLSRRGVVIALPEDRLSFHLKAIDECISGRYSNGCDFYGIEQWLRENSREILDEAEEILSVKYQLSYTVGSQLPIDNGELRWKIAQSIMSVARRCMSDFKADEAGEADFELCRFEDHRFPMFRLLRREPFKLFCNKIVNDIISVKVLKIEPSDREVLISYLIEERSDEKVLSGTNIIYQNESSKKILLQIRGLLAGGVLFFVLNRRWRVNYGVDIGKSARRRMAIPFRAKDTPMERTEFGHVDVAILFTLLSYYYSGLSDEQIDRAIANLAAETKPEEEYKRWIKEVHIITITLFY